MWMKSWRKALYWTGAAAVIAGAIDPLEGSVVILSGSILLTISMMAAPAFRWRRYLMASLLILIGVFFMFYFSWLGGWGGDSSLSWWWLILVLPYPAGWIFNLILIFSGWLKSSQT